MPLSDPEDARWARERMNRFAYAVDKLDDCLRHAYKRGSSRLSRAYRRDALELEMAVREILGALAIAAPKNADFNSSNACVAWYRAAVRALGLLDDYDELLIRVGPGGPRLTATALHPVVWSAAERLLVDSHETQAVQSAATAVSNYISGLVTTDLSEIALVREAFSSDPPKSGRARLRWKSSTASSRTIQSMNDGIRSFAQGCFQAMRNPASHGAVQLTEQQALEQLAALSTLMRWVDQCTLERAQ